MSDRQALIARLLHYKHQVPTTRERAEMIEVMREAAAALEQGTPRERESLRGLTDEMLRYAMAAMGTGSPEKAEEYRMFWCFAMQAAPPLPRDEDARDLDRACSNATARVEAIKARQRARDEDARRTQAERDVIAERRRQVEQEGWTPQHDDDEHCPDDMAVAAACYALPERHRDVMDRLDTRDAGRSVDETIYVHDKTRAPRLWPWHGGWWKPKDRRRDLVRAGALILAEIERLDRAEQERGNG